ncbi:IS1 family transposase, partial [Cronobacter sakazakii]|uniref:IS1 family transposase n=1 Tax=Cronobacter sakazakii TaxID=28141 RepID=UPI003F4511BC
MASVSISCPSCSATEGVVRNGKSTAGHQRYLCSHCRKTWQLQFTYIASQPGTHQKIIDMAMNGVGCRLTFAWGWQHVFTVMGIIGFILTVIWVRYVHNPSEHPLISQQELKYITDGGAIIDMDTKSAAK